MSLLLNVTMMKYIWRITDIMSVFIASEQLRWLVNLSLVLLKKSLKLIKL